MIARLALISAALGGAAIIFGAPAMAQYLPPTANLLLRYDTDGDGTVSRAEMENGVNADYALADADSDRCIVGDEVRGENDRRLERDGGVASPIRDWNVDGCVDMNEFGSSIRSYFNFADRSNDGSVNTAELGGPSMPIALPQARAATTNTGTGSGLSSQGTVSAAPSVLDPNSPDYIGR